MILPAPETAGSLGIAVINRFGTRISRTTRKKNRSLKVLSVNSAWSVYKNHGKSQRAKRQTAG